MILKRIQRTAWQFSKEVGNNSKKERKEETDVEQEETGEDGEKSTPEKNTEGKKKIQTE